MITSTAERFTAPCPHERRCDLSPYHEFSDPWHNHIPSANLRLDMTMDEQPIAAAACVHTYERDNNLVISSHASLSIMDLKRPVRRHRGGFGVSSAILLAVMTVNPQIAAAQGGCVSLANSTTCPAFASASVAANDSFLLGLFPFLSGVTDTQSFDTALHTYATTGYPRRYVNLFGCSDVNLSNTTDLYARYTTSFLCNAIIQNSVSICGLSTSESRPLCADSCAEFALSEQTIISSPDLCGTAGVNAMRQLRADFTNCALPADSITGSCLPGYNNEPENCGFQSNLEGLCTYCNSSTINSTDSCCVTSDVNSRCRGVTLPSFTSMPSLFTTTVTVSPSSSPTTTSTSTSTSTSTASVSNSHSGLTGGQIAGIVVGAVIGAAFLLTLLICCCLFFRRRRRREEMSSLNQPSPPRRGPPQMVQVYTQEPEVHSVPGSRITRMAAMENNQDVSTPSPARDSPVRSAQIASPIPSRGASPVVAAAALPSRKSPRGEGYDSPDSTGYVSQDAPESEQMESFKDYYSSDEIHPGDLVSTLWAYQPRAPDEFELERGDMIKIMGIWDDGWATGVRVDTRADEWEMRRDSHRDSGVSSQHTSSPSSPTPSSGLKAFPHWRRTIEGDTEPPSSDSPHPP